MLKRLFVLSLTAISLMFIGCEKWNEVDPSSVEFDVAIEYHDTPSYSVHYEYVCYGSLGGFLGEAEIIVAATDTNGGGSYNVNVTGAKTPYSFTFFAGMHQGYYKDVPSSFNVKVLVKDNVVMETIVVPKNN